MWRSVVCIDPAGNPSPPVLCAYLYACLWVIDPVLQQPEPATQPGVCPPSFFPVSQAELASDLIRRIQALVASERPRSALYVDWTGQHRTGSTVLCWPKGGMASKFPCNARPSTFPSCSSVYSHLSMKRHHPVTLVELSCSSILSECYWAIARRHGAEAAVILPPDTALCALPRIVHIVKRGSLTTCSGNRNGHIDRFDTRLLNWTSCFPHLNK